MNPRVAVSVIVGACVVYVLMSAWSELTANPVPAQSCAQYSKLTSLAPLARNNDMKLKSAKAKYRYQSDSVEDAEQMWITAAETPTAYSSFDQISTIRMRSRRAGYPDSIDHQFRIKPSGITAGGSAYKGRFFPWDTLSDSRILSSGSDHKYASGIFKAKILPDKNTGQYRLIFLYAVTSASRLGEMAETNRFDEMKARLAAVKKTNGVVATECAMTLNGLEQHDYAGQVNYKANVNSAALKVLKAPPPSTLSSHLQ
ncbi:MAG: hypothetical protein N2595_03750 [bacterium]|nr:hypothetical protein [bacterium]